MAGNCLPGPTLRRRAFLSRAASVGAALALLPALGSCAGPSKTTSGDGRFLTVVTAGGALRDALHDALFAPFARATGCQVLDSALPIDALIAELRRQVLDKRVEWDVVLLDAPRLAVLARDETRLFAQPDAGTVEATSPLPQWLRARGTMIGSDSLALATRTGPFGGNTPQDWGAAWDTTRFPGPRAFPRDPVGLLEVALLADGVTADRLYPPDLERAFRALDRLRPAIRTWWESSQRAGEALTLAQADLVLARGGDLRAALDGGALATLAPPPPPSLGITLAIAQGAPNADIARDFLARAVQPEAQAALAGRGYQPRPAASPPGTINLDLDWWGEHGATALARFTNWLAR